MEKLENIENKKQAVANFFEWLFEKKDIELFNEIDFTLAEKYYDPNIYYTKEILDFFNTDAMKRLGRVSQLGLMVAENKNCYHNRLEHSKGTYNRKLEELIYLTSDNNYKKYIEENNLKIYLIAELIKEAAHDIGHLPLSHIMEIKVIGRREFHEDIGKKILLEDKQIGEVLNNINPNLKESLKKLISEDVLNFKSHDEGNYDVDRLDYVLRDSIYNGNNIEDYYHEQYKRRYAKLDQDGNIMKNEDGSIILVEENDTKISKKQIDIYENSSLKIIEKFLEARVQAYKNMYYSKITQVRDSLVGNFVQLVLSNKLDDSGRELKDFIQQLKEKDVNIDITEYLKWDDIRFFNNCLDVAEKSNNTNLRELAGIIIPNLSALMNLIYSHLELKNAKANQFSNLSSYNKEFIRRIKNIINSNTRCKSNA